MSDRLIENAKATVRSALQECDSHVAKMEEASSSLAASFPLTEAGLKNLPPEAGARLDQFLYRFTKLQDSVAMRLLPALDRITRADDSPRPCLDMLADLEKLGIAPPDLDWQFFRNLGGNLAHDYPESLEQTVATINLLHDEWRRFAAILIRAKAFIGRLESQA